jgi:hypothetical protein
MLTLSASSILLNAHIAVARAFCVLAGTKEARLMLTWLFLLLFFK